MSDKFKFDFSFEKYGKAGRSFFNAQMMDSYPYTGDDKSNRDKIIIEMTRSGDFRDRYKAIIEGDRDILLRYGLDPETPLKAREDYCAVANYLQNAFKNVNRLVEFFPEINWREAIFEKDGSVRKDFDFVGTQKEKPEDFYQYDPYADLLNDVKNGDAQALDKLLNLKLQAMIQQMNNTEK